MNRIDVTPDGTLARVERALIAARHAGALLLRHRGRLQAVEHKGRVDLVSEADRGSEELVAAALLGAFPEDAYLGEEGGERGGGGPFRWIVDPLDGTTNYVHGLPIFAVSIGLEHDGIPVAGVVHTPALGETFHARRGAGAWRNGLPAAVSATDQLVDAILSTGLPYERAAMAPRLLADWSWGIHNLQGLRRTGAAAVDLAWTACGRLDGYWERVLSPWDFTAGAVLVEEAGGRVSRPDGAPLCCAAGPVVASNGHLHDRILAGLAEVPGP
ncbi:MAG: inositol monophosphatase family protein [Pseudomonadota bacterium]